MKIAPPTADESERLEALRNYQILDTGVEQAYQDIVELAGAICNTPIAAITLVDADRQWFKARVGLDATETSRDLAFCAHAIHSRQLFIVPDATLDERFFDNPLVTQAPNIRFYAGAPLFNQGGHILGTLCTIDRKPNSLNDFQQRALAILARQVMQLLELRRAVHQLDQTSQELRISNASKDRLLSILSHDLKTPFIGLVGLSQMISENWQEMPRSEIKELADDLATSAESGLRLVEQMLEWAMLEGKGFTNGPTHFDLRLLLEDVLSTLSSVAKQKGIDLNIHPGPPSRVHADADMCRSLFQNLVSNALKFTPPGGSVSIALFAEGDIVQCEVRDTGLGMSPGRVKQLLAANSTYSTDGTSGEKGTGLGLVLCKQRLERNRGSLSITSEPGRGSTFKISLPGSKF